MPAGLGNPPFTENILEILASRKIKERCVKGTSIFKGQREVLFMSDCLLHSSSMQTGRQLFILTSLPADQYHAEREYNVILIK